MSIMAFSRSTDAWQKLQAMVLVTSGALTIPLLYTLNPARTGVFPPCPFRWLTGWLCPGCGSLRAAHQLLRGNFAAAWSLNPLMVLLLPLLLFLLGQQLLATMNCTARERALPAAAAWALLFLTLAYTLARNLPGWPAALAAACRVASALPLG
jgi:hypothetical protein